MALDYEARYPGQITPASLSYPYGEAQNITIPGDGTGTPWEADLTNDLFGFLQGLLSRGGVIPSGLPDTAPVSQYLSALAKISGLVFNNMQDAADSDLSAVDAVKTYSSAAWTLGVTVPKGGATYQKDGTTGPGLESTIYAAADPNGNIENAGFYDSNGDGFTIVRDGAMSPYHFLAVGNGVADDSTPLQSMLTYGGWAHISNGTFVANSDLTASDNTTLSFDDTGQIDAAGSVVTLLTLGNDNTITNPRMHETRTYASIPNSSRAIYASGKSDIRISGGEIDSFTYGGIYGTGVTNITIDNVEVHSTGDKTVNLGRGIRFAQPLNTNVKITNCHIHSNGHHGITFFDSSFTIVVADKVTISDNTLFDNGDQGVATQAITNFTISDNVCLENGDNGLGTGGQGISVGSSGMVTPYAQRGTITGNVCNDHVNGYGIEIINTRYVTVGDNTCNGNTYSGITVRLGSLHITITGNTCDANNVDGIKINGTVTVSSYIKVTDNTCSGNGQRGIHSDTCEYVSVNDNTCLDNCLAGFQESIHFANGSNNSADNNLCDEPAAGGNIDYHVRLYNETDSIATNTYGGNGNIGRQGITNGSTGCILKFKSKETTPATLVSSNNNNYATLNATVMRMTGSNAGTSAITGMYAGSGAGDFAGYELEIINVGAYNIGITNQDANSSAWNRIITPTGGTITITPGNRMKFYYDFTTQRWRSTNLR